MNQPGKHRTSRRTGRQLWLLFAATVTALVAVAVVGFATVLHIADGLVDGMRRGPDPFTSIPETKRPDKAPSTSGKEGVTFLLVGTDARSSGATTGTERVSDIRGRSDVMMLAHITADRDHAYVVSIPRDSWVSIPGYGQGKINSSYAYGGPSLAIRTVERLTGIRIDHFAAIDFTGFVRLTDALGGVSVTPHGGITATDLGSRGKHLGGLQTLAYVRQRDGLPRGDLDRVHRQQAWLRAITQKLTSAETLTQPKRYSSISRALSRTVTIGQDLSNGEIYRLAFSLRRLDPDDVTFMTAPVAGTGYANGQSIVRLDQGRGQRLWTAVEEDALPNYLSRFEADTLKGVRQ